MFAPILLFAALARAHLAPEPADAPPPFTAKLSQIVDANWRSPRVVTLNGRPASVGFVVARKDQPYVSILGAGERMPILLNIRALVGSPKRAQVNGKTYEISLSPHVFDRLGSRIDIEGEGEKQSFAIRELMEHAFYAGLPLYVNGRELRLSYYEDIDNEAGFGRPVGARRQYAIIVKRKDECKFVLLPAENLVPGAVSVMNVDGDRVALRQTPDGRVVIVPAP